GGAGPGAAGRPTSRAAGAPPPAGAGARAAGPPPPARAAGDAARAYRTAQRERRTVVLAMPLDVQAGQCEPPKIPPVPALAPTAPAPEAAAPLAPAPTQAERPGFVAGRRPAGRPRAPGH